jgi:molybdopterin converting factor small subunit
MRVYVGGQSEVPVQGQTVEAAMHDLMSRFPAMRPHLYNERGELRPFVNLFISQVNVRDLQGLQTPLGPQDKVRLVPAIAGG